jgi:hypothetical protein
MSKRLLALLNVTALLIGGASRCNSSQDNLCGPRAVLDVLRAYHQPAGLNDILADVPPERVWSLQDVCDSLNGHGLVAKCVHLNDPRKLQWKWPIVLHLNPLAGPRSSDTNVGHFVVLFPNPPHPNKPLLDSAEWRPWSAIDEQFSGRAVLTAPSQRDYVFDATMHYLSVAIALLTLSAVTGALTWSFVRNSATRRDEREQIAASPPLAKDTE